MRPGAPPHRLGLHRSPQGGSLEGQARQDSHYRFIINGIEDELIGIFDLAGEAVRYRGRAEGPKFVRKCVLPTPTRGFSRSSEAGRCWRWVQQWCEGFTREAMKHISAIQVRYLLVGWGQEAERERSPDEQEARRPGQGHRAP